MDADTLNARIPSDAREDPDNPGWFAWADLPADTFAAATGRLLFRADGPGRGIVRMHVTDKHLNLGGSIHGGAVMSFIDMARAHYVTLDLTTHFLARGVADKPLDAHVELLRQTRSLAFLQGVVRQEGEACYSFAGTLKRLRKS
jgi:acyl-coenzyme A thioesterase PaaI-like protein